MENYSIEKNDCSHLEELIELTKSYYSEGDIISKEYLEWQYLNNPAGKPYLFTSREANTNALVGQYLVIPINFNVSGEIVPGSLSLNTLTHPKHQGKGLFTKMAKATYVDCGENETFFTTGFPNPMSYPGFVKKLDFAHLGDIPLLINPLKPINIFFSYFKKEKEKHGGAISIEALKKEERIKEFNFNKDSDKLRYEKFWNQIKKQYTVTTNKDYNFLKWRYKDIPTRNYKIFYSEEEGSITGLIVLKAEHVWGFNVGLVMDLMVLENKERSGRNLLKYSKKVFSKANLDFIAALHSPIKEFSVFKKSGFFTVPQKVLPQKIHFIVRENKKFPNSDLIFDLKNWKLTFGDYDVF